MSTTIIQIEADDLQRVVAAEVQKGVEAALSKILQPTKAESDEGEYLTRAEVCNLLHISKVTFHDWVNRGLIPVYKAGTRTLCRAAELRQMLENGDIRRYKHQKQRSDER